MGNNAKKIGVLRWRGLLDETSFVVRCMVGVVLATSGAAFAFTQLGFIGITLPDGTAGYVVTLLAATALGALLLGAPIGAVLGMVAGGVLLLHAYLTPLDYYELMYVTPLTSIVMLGACGALLGILFAFALRNDPAQSRRVVYIVVICIVVSWLYSLAFATNVIASIASVIVESMEGSFTYSSTQQAASAAAMYLGNMGLQAWSTALRPSGIL